MPPETSLLDKPDGIGSLTRILSPRWRELARKSVECSARQQGVMPQPIKIANNIGKPALGVENWPESPTVPAPCVLLNRPSGIGKTVTFYLQGFIVDSAAPNGKAAVTNGIEVISQ